MIYMQNKELEWKTWWNQKRVGRPAPNIFKYKIQAVVSRKKSQEQTSSSISKAPYKHISTNAIRFAANPVFLERIKHIEVDCHFIREAYDDEIIILPHGPSELQIANIVTNALPQYWN